MVAPTLLLVVILAACADLSSPGATTVVDLTVPETEIASDAGTTTTTVPRPKPLVFSDPTSPATTAPPVLESADAFGPLLGDEVGVVGVVHDDVLNVRAAPGSEATIVATLDPLDRTTATGRHREVADAVWWWEVTAGDVTGWAYSAYLSRLGDPVSLSGIDVTLTAPTLDALGRLVVDGRLETLDPDSTVTLVLAPRAEHDQGEVVYDITGSGDDSISGYRVHVYAQPTDDRQAFQLQGVELTTMCWRGVVSGVCT